MYSSPSLSDELEAGDDSRLPPHCLTGAFADAAREASFRASLFREAFAVHMVLLAAMLITDLLYALLEPVTFGYAAFDALLLCGRVWLHRMEDRMAAQRVGGIVWTAWVAVNILCFGLLESSTLCDAEPFEVGWFLYLLMMAFIFSYMNASHGLGFWH